MIVDWIRKFEPNGSVTDMVHGALKIVPTEENLEIVRETSQSTPRHYARRHSHILGGTRRSLERDISYIEMPTAQKVFGGIMCLGWGFVTRRWASTVKMPVFGIMR